jgi:hypothetical protein
MRIRLHEYYIGHASNERVIEPGDYEEEDPGLHGADPAYLVAIGKAVIIADEADSTFVLNSDDDVVLIERQSDADAPTAAEAASGVKAGPVHRGRKRG